MFFSFLHHATRLNKGAVKKQEQNCLFYKKNFKRGPPPIFSHVRISNNYPGQKMAKKLHFLVLQSVDALTASSAAAVTAVGRGRETLFNNALKP